MSLFYTIVFKGYFFLFSLLALTLSYRGYEGVCDELAWLISSRFADGVIMKQSKLPFSLFFKPIGSQCNLDCRYCYYWNKHDVTVQRHIGRNILETAIKQHIDAQPDGDRPIEFIWHGGEPLLAGLAFYQTVVEIQSQHLSCTSIQGSKKRSIQNTMQTNGSLITRQWAQFFADQHFMLGISIDGPKELHDISRIDKQGRSSFERTIRGIGHLKTAKVEFNTLSVINNQTYQCGRDIYQFLKLNGSGYMQFQPCLDHELDQRDERNWSLNGAQWGAFLSAVFDQWCKEDIGKVYVQFFENCLMILMGYPSQMCHHSLTCGQQLAMEKDGTVYSCDHYVYEDYTLGKIAAVADDEAVLETMVNGATQRGFGQMKSDSLTVQCKQCDFLSLCQGGCPKYRTDLNREGQPHNVLCEGYQLFFKHALPTLIPMVSAMKKGYAPEYYVLFR